MTLARKLVLQLGLLTLGLSGASAAVIWGLVGLQELADTAGEEFNELRYVRRAHGRLDQATIYVGQRQFELASGQLREAARYIEAFERFQITRQTTLDRSHAMMEQGTSSNASASIREALSLLEEPEAPAGSALAVEQIGSAMRLLETLSGGLEAAVGEAQRRTVARNRMTAWSLGSLFVGMLVAATIFNIRHYRSIITPLQRLQQGARLLAKGDLSTRLRVQADEELEQLQEDFNQMAGELQSLYADLETRVAQKSRELVASERLASVGYLAAGLSHEINNPLGIVSGYAESLLRRLPHHAAHPLHDELVKGLEIVRDEAFRCKRITEGLLNLSRMGDQHREQVSMRQVIEDVARLLHVAPAAHDRTIEVDCGNDDSLAVQGSAPELKQVVLNLALNALESVSPGGGRVWLRAERSADWVTLRVHDNGRGMSTESLNKVFEPFYTAGKGARGIGLGLSISYAIVQRHGGTLQAASPGPEQGSVFTLRLPASEEGGP